MTIQQVRNVFKSVDNPGTLFATLSIPMFGILVWRIDYVARKYVTLAGVGRVIKISPEYISELVIS